MDTFNGFLSIRLVVAVLFLFGSWKTPPGSEELLSQREAFLLRRRRGGAGDFAVPLLSAEVCQRDDAVDRVVRS